MTDHSRHSPDPIESESNLPADEQAVKRVQELSACVKGISTYECENEAKYHFNSITFLESIRNELSECNTQFLTDYLKVLASNNKMTISCVTEKIMTSIEHIVMTLRDQRRLISESDMIVLMCWLCAATLWDQPQVTRSHTALHALLPYLTEQETQRINEVWQRCASPPALLALSDAARRAPPAPSSSSPAPGDALASLLLQGGAGAGAAGAGGPLLAVRWAARQLRAGQHVQLSDDNANTDIQERLAVLKVKQIIFE